MGGLHVSSCNCSNLAGMRGREWDHLGCAGAIGADSGGGSTAAAAAGLWAGAMCCALDMDHLPVSSKGAADARATHPGC
jgi:hypothetical protein